MKTIAKYLAFGALAVSALAGCRNFSFMSFMRGDLLASVGEQKLYADDLPLQYTGLTPADSLKLLQSYVDLWVRQQLKIRQAENASSPEAEERIGRMVDDYRRSLLIYEYEKAYIDQRLDTTITAEEVQACYNANPDGFRLATPLLKGVVVRFPAGFRQEGQMRMMALSGQPERIQDLVDMAVKNNFPYREFTDWTEAARMTAFLPRMNEQENARLLRPAPSFFETEQGEYRYFVVVTDLLPAASPMPLDRARETIRTLVITRRKQDLVRGMDEELLRNALLLKEIKIHIDTAAVAAAVPEPIEEPIE